MDRDEIEDSLAHIIPQAPLPQYIDDTVFLEVKELLEKHPEKLVKSWSEKPRLYTLLRMLDYKDESEVFTKFDKEQIGDFWLPLGTATLNQLAATANISASKFRRTQLHILSKPEQMSEEKLLGPTHTHRHIQYGSSHFEEMGPIGKGGSAEVVRVKHKLSGKQFACKRILRAETIKLQRTQLIEFEQEVGVLRRLSHNPHHHFVSFVASFTDLASFSLILSPVASDVLKALLDRQSRDQPLPDADISILRRSLGCLSTAVAHLHQQHVRHKDIKPGNILIDSRGQVLLCDFGISLDWSNSEHSTTEGVPHKFTSRYCAPEVSERDPRNTKSDIWSLGCVFIEIITVVHGYTIGEFNDFLLDNNNGEGIVGLWSAPDALRAWLVKMKSETPDSADDLPVDWITPMIRTEPQDRMKASDIVDMIRRQSATYNLQPNLFVGPCCSRSGSIAQSEVIDSPTLTNPGFGRDNILGISHMSASPPRYLELPNRKQSPASIDERSKPPRSRNGESDNSRDRSVSPRTRHTHSPMDSEDAVQFPMDPPLSPAHKPLQHISSRTDSQHTSSFSFPKPPESIASSSGFRRSPVPPPASFDVKCGCAPRPNEQHIFNASFVSVDLDHETLRSNATDTIDDVIPTAESCPKCEIGENRLQIYETAPADPNTIGGTQAPMIWWVTRRLVISYLSGTPEMRRCSSFWLPLADTQFLPNDSEVTLRWSDCNQMTQRSSGNYSQHYDWLYNPKQPNNGLTLRFNQVGDMHQFIDAVRLPYEDGVTVSHGRQIEASPSTETNIFDIGRRGVRNYRVAVLTDVRASVLTSKLFVQWPEMDLNIQTQLTGGRSDDYQMFVECTNVSTPTYHSDVRNEPAVDYQKIGRFNKALQLKAGFSVVFSIGMARELPVPPSGVVDLLQGLTGWTFRYFGIINDLKSKRKRFGTKKYGRADIMLWERELDDPYSSSKRRGSRVSFRQHEEGAEFLWTCATIIPKSSISFSSANDATITVANKTRGRLLDVSTMSAVNNESKNPREPRNGHAHGTSDPTNELSELVLTFHDPSYRRAFFNIFEDLKSTAAAATPIARVPTRISTSVESVRRNPSTVSTNMHASPPMR